MSATARSTPASKVTPGSFGKYQVGVLRGADGKLGSLVTIAGFGVVGAAMRRRRVTAAFA